MTEHFFHLPDTTIFHGIPQNVDGFSFKEARALTDDDEKISRLKTRLEGYYVSGLKDINHPFIAAIMTCVGLEVLGQVIFGFDAKGESIESYTINVYKMLDSNISQPLSSTFAINYNKKRNRTGQTTDFTNSFTSYANVIRKGLRNSFTHNYRSLGVILSDSQSDLMTIEENEGCIIVNPFIFKQKFINCFEDSFLTALFNSNQNYRAETLKYFDLLIK